MKELTFRNPPVVEAVLAIQFDPIPGWGAQHFGLLWPDFGERYPKCETREPLDPVVEGDHPRLRSIADVRLVAVDPGHVRCWFMNDDESRLIQIQRDRFVFNWRKRTELDEYPRYSRTLQGFLQEWGTLTAFLGRIGLERPKPDQFEVTYVNHIQKGHGWEDYSELGNVFTCWSAASGGGASSAEWVEFKMALALPSWGGRLYASAQPVRRASDGNIAIQFKLTARGGDRSESDTEMASAFDQGHEAAINAFETLTTERMHALWEKE